MKANVWHICLKSKKTGVLVVTQCDRYKNYKNMKKRLEGLGIFEVVQLNPAPDNQVVISWDMLIQLHSLIFK